MTDKLPFDILARVLATQTPDHIAQVFGGQLGRIASLFQLDDDNASKNRLASILIDYIKAAPAAMDNLATTARDYHLGDDIVKYTRLAQKDINRTYEALRAVNTSTFNAETFLALLQNAYFVMRLVEEINDGAEHFMGIPITGTNPMTANIMAHGIIGDRFGNRLDSIVAATIMPSALTKAIVEAQLDSARITALKQSHCALSGEPVVDFIDTYRLSMF